MQVTENSVEIRACLSSRGASFIQLSPAGYCEHQRGRDIWPAGLEVWTHRL